MSPDQLIIIRETRDRLEPQLTELSSTVHAALYEVDANTSSTFRGGGGAGCDVGALLDLLVNMSEDPHRLVPTVAELGRRHAESAVRQADYRVTGIALLRALERLLGPAFTPEVHDAWAEAFAVVSTVMERGALRASGEWNPRSDPGVA